MNEDPLLQINIENPQDIYTYHWEGPNNYTAATDEIFVTETGTYFVYVTSNLGCESEIKQIVISNETIQELTYNDINVSVDINNNNIITILSDNIEIANFEFALDNTIRFQDSPHFINVPAGVHTVYMRDKEHCGLTSIIVSVIGYARFFTYQYLIVLEKYLLSYLLIQKAGMAIIMVSHYPKLITGSMLD